MTTCRKVYRLHFSNTNRKSVSLLFFFKILIADDLTLKGKLTNLLSVVKSSKIIAGIFS